MKTLNLDKNYVLEKIRSAFEGVVNPQEKMIPDNSPSAILEFKYEFKSFLSKKRENWWDINDKIIGYHHDALSFFSCEGLHFVLPAYMSYALKYPDSLAKSSTIYLLTPPDKSKHPEWLERFIKTVSLFTREQVEAIILFLKYQEEIDSKEIINIAAEALKSYWNQFIIEDKPRSV
jgi:hypothetical protein